MTDQIPAGTPGTREHRAVFARDLLDEDLFETVEYALTPGDPNDWLLLESAEYPDDLPDDERPDGADSDDVVVFHCLPDGTDSGDVAILDPAGIVYIRPAADS